MKRSGGVHAGGAGAGLTNEVFSQIHYNNISCEVRTLTLQGQNRYPMMGHFTEEEETFNTSQRTNEDVAPSFNSMWTWQKLYLAATLFVKTIGHPFFSYNDTMGSVACLNMPLKMMSVQEHPSH